MSTAVDDLESSLLYAEMQEAPGMKWAFNRLVYASLIGHFLLTVAVAALVSSVHVLSNFFRSTKLGLAIYILIISVTIIVPFLQRRYPRNSFMIVVFNLTFAFAIGVLCAYVGGRVVIETIIAVIVVFVCLVPYSLLGAFFFPFSGFLAPFLFSLLVIVLTFTISQLCSPMGKVTDVICSGLTVIVFIAYVLYDTDTMIKRHSSNASMWAMLFLFQDIPYLFIDLFKVLRIIN